MNEGVFMKKIIIRVILFLIFLVVVYSGFLARDILRVRNFVKRTSATKSERVRTIGIQGLCKSKNIDYDENKHKIDESLNKLIKVREDYLNFYVSFLGFTYLKINYFPFLKVRISAKDNELETTGYQEKDSDTEKFSALKKDIRNFDDVFKLESIKDYNWNVIESTESDKKNPLSRIFIISSSELIQLSTLIGLTEKYTKKDIEAADSSILFNSLLKIYLLNSYINKGHTLSQSSNYNLETLYVFYDNIINDKYSTDEMKSMLKTIKQALPLIPDYKESIKIQYEHNLKMYKFAFSEFPCLAYTIRFLSGNPFPILEKMYSLFDQGKYKEAGMYLHDHNLICMVLVSPEFLNYYEDHNNFVDLKSKLALMQAVLEDKLGLTITAVDPFDGKPIRSIKKDDGKIIYYCLGHTGRDEKGTGINIFNCDTKLKTKIVEPQEK